MVKREPLGVAPKAKTPHGSQIGQARVLVSDVGRKELNEALFSLSTGILD